MGTLQNNIVMRSITDLIAYANNARTHSYDQINKIVKSIQAFGFLNPVLIDEKNNIICGHGRVMAAESMGMSEVPCVIADNLTEDERRAYIIADNRLSELSDWDNDLLKQEIQDLDALGLEIELTGFSLEDFTMIDNNSCTSNTDPINLDDQDNSKERTTCFCPKCGFEFEV